MRKSISIVTVLMLVLSGIVFLIPITNVSATSDNTWIADVPSSASVDASWENGTLTAGQNIWFVDAHDGNCAWDVAGSFGNFSLRTGYAGTVTLQASISVTSYYQLAGIVSGSLSPLYIISDSGNFCHVAGTHTLSITMTGTGNSITSKSTISYLTINGDTTWKYLVAVSQRLTIQSGKTLTLSSELDLRTYNIPIFLANDGTITGSGIFKLVAYSTQPSTTISFGNIQCPILIELASSTTENYSLILSTSAILSSSLEIKSASATYYFTLDLSTNNYTLSTTSITIGTRGIFNARASQITASGNWDSSAGTFTKGTSTVHLTGISKTLKTAGTGFNNLVIESGASIQLLSNVTTEYLWNNGTLDLNGFTMTVNHDQAPSITSSAIVSCHFIDDYYYNVTATDQEKETLTYGLTTTWPNAAINTTTGKITNSQPLGNGTWSLNVSVTDGNHTVYQSFNLNIWNYAPIFTTYARYQVMILDNYFYFANATDPEGYTITYNCTITVTWLVWNPANHSLSGIPFDRDIGYYDVSISAWDGYQTTWQNYTIQIQGPLTTTIMTFLIYFVFQIVLLILGLIGYFRIPFLLYIEVIGTIAIAWPTVASFDAYRMLALILVLTNTTIPIIGLSRRK